MILKRRIKTVILLIMKSCMFSAWFWFHWTGDRKDSGGGLDWLDVDCGWNN